MTLASMFLEDSVSSHSIEKICRYMSGCDREFYRALATLRGLQKERVDVEEDPADFQFVDGGGSDASPASDGDFPDDDPEPPEVSPSGSEPAEEGQPAVDASTVRPQGSAAASGYDGDSIGEVDPGGPDGRGVPPDAAADIVRMRAQKLSADQIAAAVMADPERLARLSTAELIRLRASLDRSMWEDTRKLDAMIDRMSAQAAPKATSPQAPVLAPDQNSETNPTDEVG